MKVGIHKVLYKIYMRKIKHIEYSLTLINENNKLSIYALFEYKGHTNGVLITHIHKKFGKLKNAKYECTNFSEGYRVSVNDILNDAYVYLEEEESNQILVTFCWVKISIVLKDK